MQGHRPRQRRLLPLTLVVASLAGACSSQSPATDAGAGNADATGAADATPPADAGPCPADMTLVGATCVDYYEAPNLPGALPLVMYSFHEAEAWCAARQKRLCFEDEWLLACAGPDGNAYPYGDTRVPGLCNDEETWRTYDQNLLNGWPDGVSAPDVTSVDDLLARARAVSPTAAAAADHVAALYQGEGSGDNADCRGAAGVLDLVGNVEEWTRRRTSGGPEYDGNLKGRYWAESRTCQSNVTVHADPFRFYEIGFRCCRDAYPDAASD